MRLFWMQLSTAMKNLLVAFVDTLFIHTIRASLLIGGVVLLLSNTGAWQYFSNSMLAHDITRAAAWSGGDTSLSKVVVLAIDDAGYQGYFGGQSPIDRLRVKQLLEAVAAHATQAKRIIVDLDVSPVPGQAGGQKALDALLQLNPDRWVLSAVDSGAAHNMAELDPWRTDLCKSGIRFGLPLLPHQFGYPRFTHQYQGSLAAVALQGAPACADPNGSFAQKVMPLSPTMLQTGLVIPFNGDLQALGAMLQAIGPDYVVVGGAWGKFDTFSTPFGERYGVQLHAAAISGALEQQRLAPYILQLVVAWLFVGSISLLFGYLTEAIGRWTAPMGEHLPGHRFFVRAFVPFAFSLITIGLLLVLVEALSLLHAKTGYWIGSSVVACTAMAAMLLIWNWGRGVPRRQAGLRQAWRDVVAQPIAHDIGGIRRAFKILVHGPLPLAIAIAPYEVMVSRKRAAFDGSFALLSLCMQTLTPLCLVGYAVFKPL
jgi:hypothetical protein